MLATDTAKWTDVLQAIGAILTPLAVAGLVFMLTRMQSRSDELLKARLEYYKLLVPNMNLLMCYMMFIGPWRDTSPREIIDLKRRLDKDFHCAAPLFSSEVMTAYDDVMGMSFLTFGNWVLTPEFVAMLTDAGKHGAQRENGTNIGTSFLN